MPERWQRELKKLRDEEMPERIRERAERDPQRELPNEGRQRVVAGIVAFAVFIGAGVFAWRAFNGEGSPASDPAVPSPSEGRVVLGVLSADGDPTATLSFGGVTQRGLRERFEWCAEGQTCVAEIPAPKRLQRDYLAVPAGASIETAGDGTVTRLVVRTAGANATAANVVSESDGTGSLMPDEAGRYELWVAASWGERRAAAFVFGVEVSPPTDQVPDVLHLTCTPETASLDANVVRTRPDGVHIAVDASDDVRGVDIVNGPDAEEFSGVGFPVDGQASRAVPIEPGTWHVGCYGGARTGVVHADIGTERAATFTIVDPDGYYAPVELACDEPSTRLFPVTGTPSGGVAGSYEASPRTVEESAAAVPGILPTDVVREAGYVDGPGFKLGPIYSVLRDGAAIARLHVPVEVSSTWGVSVEACPGSGVGPDAPAGAAGPTPDTAVVRCLESRIEVATPVVNTQPDGLHVEVENAGGSQRLVVVGVGERTRVFSFPTEVGSTSLVVPVNPGGVQIACRSNAETVGSDDPFLDRHSGGLHLHDRGGYFVPYAPTCDSSEEIPIEPPKAVIRPRGEAFIRGNLAGVVGSDTVERAGYLQGRGDEGPWRVVRDGEIVAQVEYPSLEGVTCRGAGISGT